MLAAILACVLAGSIVYCILVIIAVVRFRPVPECPAGEPVSVLKPLAGLDHGLEENLRSFFEQRYPVFEILFAVRRPDDAAIPVVEKLRREFPSVPSRLIVTGEPPYANAKVYSLERMVPLAAHDLIVMSDSDIRVAADFLARVASEFASTGMDLCTCPYRAVGGPSLWSQMEAEGMNTEFWGGVLVARMLEGVRFTIGPTVAARRRVLDAVPFAAVKDYLAEDFMLGQLAAQAGFHVGICRAVVEHRIGSQTARANLRHRLRWARSTRRSRPSGYIGQLFTNPLPLALALCAARPGWWPLAGAAILLRGLAGHAVAARVLHVNIKWLLLPLQDLLSFVMWVAGFFGETISWRGRTYRLNRDGTFTLLSDPYSEAEDQHALISEL